MNQEEKIKEYNELAENFYGLGAESIEVEDNTFDENTEPWVVAYYDVDNDLHNTYDHDELIDELYKLNDKIRFFDEATDMGDGILALYLDLDITATSELIKQIKEGLKQVPSIIEKFYKED